MTCTGFKITILFTLIIKCFIRTQISCTNNMISQIFETVLNDLNIKKRLKTLRGYREYQKRIVCSGCMAEMGPAIAFTITVL